MFANTPDQIKALKFQHPEHIPVIVGLGPAVWRKYREALEEIVMRHPILFGEHKPGSVNFDILNPALFPNYEEGEHRDPWGYIWTNLHWGCDAYVSKHPLPRREMVWDFKPPLPGAGIPHGFLFLRLTYLRGYEEAMLDFAEEPPELQRLIDIIMEYTVNEMEPLLRKPPMMIGFADDLGTQRAMPISPEKWRRFLKPCYGRLFGMCHDAGALTFLHSDGHIIPIIADLIKSGLDMLNVQVQANGIDSLVRECKGRICLMPEIEGQVLATSSPAEINASVGEIVEKLGAPEGGLFLLADCSPDVPLENIEAVCQSFEKHRGHFRLPDALIKSP